LRTAGHDVTWGQDFKVGASDDVRLTEANAEGRIILTEDRDFAEMVMAVGLNTHGLILVALNGLGRQARIDLVVKAVEELGSSFGSEIAVIEPGRVRRRKI
jgi:predicted nuclease of predicted toxin-antitoxin system